MLAPLTTTQQKNLARNILAACRDIEKLNRPGYVFISGCSGFIAHYDLSGFKSAYSEPGSLARDILAHARFNQWGNFRPGERDADYYHSKRDCYNMILGAFAAQQFIREHVQFIHVA